MIIDIVIISILMVVLFLRQIHYFNRRVQINFAPVVMGLGFVGVFVHVMLNPIANLDHLLANLSVYLLPLFISTTLYLFMTLFYQALGRMQHEDIHDLKYEVNVLANDIKERLSKHESYLETLGNYDEESLQKMHEMFANEVQTLHDLKANQRQFFDKADTMLHTQKEMLEIAKQYVDEDMEKFDNVMVRHVDILHVSLKEHFKTLSETLKENRGSGAREQLQILQAQAEKLSELLQISASSIVEQTNDAYENWLERLKYDGGAFEQRMKHVLSLTNEHQQRTELINKQFKLLNTTLETANSQVDSFVNKGKGLETVLEAIHKVNIELYTVQEEYKNSKNELRDLFARLGSSENEKLQQVYLRIETLTRQMENHLTNSLTILNEHVAQDSNAKFKNLTHKNQLKMIYGENKNE
jgi:hypothetical protein